MIFKVDTTWVWKPNSTRQNSFASLMDRLEIGNCLDEPQERGVEAVTVEGKGCGILESRLLLLKFRKSMVRMWLLVRIFSRSISFLSSFAISCSSCSLSDSRGLLIENCSWLRDDAAKAAEVIAVAADVASLLMLSAVVFIKLDISTGIVEAELLLLVVGTSLSTSF